MPVGMKIQSFINEFMERTKGLYEDSVTALATSEGQLTLVKEEFDSMKSGANDEWIAAKIEEVSEASMRAGWAKGVMELSSDLLDISSKWQSDTLD